MLSSISMPTKVALAALVALGLSKVAVADNDFCYSSTTWKYASGNEAPACVAPYADFSLNTGGLGFEDFPCEGSFNQLCCDEDQAGADDSPYQVQCYGVRESKFNGVPFIYGIQKLPSKRRL